MRLGKGGRGAIFIIVRQGRMLSWPAAAWRVQGWSTGEFCARGLAQELAELFKGEVNRLSFNGRDPDDVRLEGVGEIGEIERFNRVG